MNTKRVRECLKELENAENTERIVEVLLDFQQNLKPTEQLLRETKVGVAVNKLRSHSDPKVNGLVKKLVASWRETVQQEKARQQRAKQRTVADSPSAGGSPNTTNGTSGSAGKPDLGKPTIIKKRDWKSDGVDTIVYNDQVRNSCIQVTYNALVVDSSQPAATVLKAAKEVESAVFEAEKSTSTNYRNKLRSLFMYLKDPKNPTLRQQVVLGKISGERLRTMKPAEMANDELKKQMEEIEKQNLFNAQSAQEQRATTDRFTCGKCKQKKVSYYQLQTRSADEPLTTFCTCENCGNRWKFS